MDLEFDILVVVCWFGSGLGGARSAVLRLWGMEDAVMP